MAYSSARCLDDADCLQAGLLEAGDPALLDLVDRHRVEVVKPLPSSPHDGDEVGPHEDVEMLRRRLARHVEALAQFAQRLAVALPETVEQEPPGGVGQRLEDRVHPVSLNAHRIMQANTCISQRGCRFSSSSGVHRRRSEFALAIPPVLPPRALRMDDYITSTHRGHGHCLAKGAPMDRMTAGLLCEGFHVNSVIATRHSRRRVSEGFSGGDEGAGCRQEANPYPPIDLDSSRNPAAC